MKGKITFDKYQTNNRSIEFLLYETVCWKFNTMVEGYCRPSNPWMLKSKSPSYTWSKLSELIIKNQVNFALKYFDFNQKQIRSFVSDFYPFGIRRNHPYQGWLKAVNKLLPKDRVSPILENKQGYKDKNINKVKLKEESHPDGLVLDISKDTLGFVTLKFGNSLTIRLSEMDTKYMAFHLIEAGKEKV